VQTNRKLRASTFLNKRQTNWHQNYFWC